MSFSLYSVIISSRVGFRVKRYACMVNKLFIYINVMMLIGTQRESV